MHIASAATSVKFHDFPSGNVVWNYQPGTKVDGNIRSISWSKDGNWLALVPHSGLIEIVTIKDQLRLMHTIQNIEEPSCASFQNTTKKLIALGTQNGQVLVYDIKARSVRKRFPRTTSLISYVEFLAKDTHLVASSAGGDVFIYNNVTNNLSSSFKIPKSETVSALRTNPTKRHLITGGSNEGIIVVWDIYVNKHKFFTDAHKAPVTSVSFSPVNSDLVLSTGLDRQFCFYDIVSRDCIATVPVENSISCADFSPDGTNFVLASQNGKIYVYDSRRIQEPSQIFDGHRTAVKHLLFQKCEDNDTREVSRISDQFNVIKEDEAREPEIQVTETQDATDSFGLFIEGNSPIVTDGVTKSQVSSSQVSTPEAGDSFMAAMGLDNSNMDSAKVEHSLKITEGVKKWMNSKVSVMNDTPCIPADSPAQTKPIKLYQEKMLLYEVKNKRTSTPKYLSQDIASNISPIVPDANSPAAKVSQAQDAVLEAVKNEVKQSLDEASKYLDFQLKSGMSNIRQICLDLHMAMIKEFIKMEHNFNSLREELSNEVPLSDHLLLEENMKLKKRVAELEQQLTSKSGHQNGID